jgi:hypothetical protein
MTSKYGVVVCDNRDGTMKQFSLEALYMVIKRHKLKPVNGEYQITEALAAEAAAYDERHGTKPTTPPESLADLKATVEGKPNTGKWEETDLDQIEREEAIERSKTRKVMTDDAYADLLVKLRKLFVEERPPHELALRVTTHMAVGLAIAELGMDAPTAKAWFSKATDEFIGKLEAYDINRH